MTIRYVLLGGFFGQDEPYDELGTYDSIEDLMAAAEGSEPQPHKDNVEYDFYTHRETAQ